MKSNGVSPRESFGQQVNDHRSYHTLHESMNSAPSVFGTDPGIALLNTDS